MGALHAGAVTLGCAGPAATSRPKLFDKLGDQAASLTTTGDLFSGPADRLECAPFYRSELRSDRAALSVWDGKIGLIMRLTSSR